MTERLADIVQRLRAPDALEYNVGDLTDADLEEAAAEIERLSVAATILQKLVDAASWLFIHDTGNYFSIEGTVEPLSADELAYITTAVAAASDGERHDD